MANVNEPRFVAFPKEVLTGVLLQDVTPDAVAASLVAAGVAAGAVQFLQGAEGLRILNPLGDRGPIRQRLQRKIEHLTNEGEILEHVAERLEEGRTIIGVFGEEGGRETAEGGLPGRRGPRRPLLRDGRHRLSRVVQYLTDESREPVRGMSYPTGKEPR
jgi:hypothetical protein